MKKNGIDSESLEKLLEVWGLEGNIVEKEIKDGKDFYILESLCTRHDFTSLKEYERLNASIKLKELIYKNNMNSEEADEYVNYVDTLLFANNKE